MKKQALTGHLLWPMQVVVLLTALNNWRCADGKPLFAETVSSLCPAGNVAARYVRFAAQRDILEWSVDPGLGQQVFAQIKAPGGSPETAELEGSITNPTPGTWKLRYGSSACEQFVTLEVGDENECWGDEDCDGHLNFHDSCPSVPNRDQSNVALCTERLVVQLPLGTQGTVAATPLFDLGAANLGHHTPLPTQTASEDVVPLREMDISLVGGMLTGNATISISYDAAELAMLELRSTELGLYRLDPTSGNWLAVPSIVDSELGVVRASVDHFSVWALAARVLRPDAALRACVPPPNGCNIYDIVAAADPRLVLFARRYFSRLCDRHDDCYSFGSSTYQKDKLDCDNDLRQDILSHCPWTAALIGDPGCLQMSAEIYAGTLAAGGAYYDAEQEHCCLYEAPLDPACGAMDADCDNVGDRCGWREDFDDQELSLAWNKYEYIGPRADGCSTPANHYSLTDNPGYLRYLFDPMTHYFGFINAYQGATASCCLHDPGLELWRPLEGENWTVELRTNYHLPYSSGRSLNFAIYFGEGSNTDTYFVHSWRFRDVNQNWLDFGLLHQTGPSPNLWNDWTPIAAAPRTNYALSGPDDVTVCYRIERNRGVITGSRSSDCATWSIDFSANLGNALDNRKQRFSISGLSFADPQGFAEYDYVYFTKN